MIKGGGIHREHQLKKDMLRVRGCWTSFICGGEDWTRITDPNTPPLPPAAAPQPAKGAVASKKAPATTVRDAAPAVDPICSNVGRLVPRVS